jgi:cholesterol transport system auxiliary component
MDGTAMYYRLAYQNAAVPQPYAESDWVMSPAALLTQRLQSNLADKENGERLHVSMHGAASYTLHGELVEFEQIFDAPDRSRGVLRLRATLEGEGVRTQRTFAIERPARTPNAAGGVVALTECSDELVRLITEWASASRAGADEAAAADLETSRPSLSAQRER